MERATVFPHIRIAASIFWMTVCGLLIVLWLRSYRAEDRVSGHYSSSLGIRFYSSRGWIVCSKNSSPSAGSNYPWALEIGADFWLDPDDNRLKFAVPLDFFAGSSFSSITIPHWFPAIVSGILAAMLWVGPHFRFSVRSLLMAITLIAVVLGLAAVTAHE